MQNHKTHKMLNLNKCTKTKPKPTVDCKNCSYVCAYRCVHNTAQNSSDNCPSCPPDNHDSSDDVHWRGGETTAENKTPAHHAT